MRPPPPRFPACPPTGVANSSARIMDRPPTNMMTMPQRMAMGGAMSEPDTSSAWRGGVFEGAGGGGARPCGMGRAGSKNA
jgi:hypothetical protein